MLRVLLFSLCSPCSPCSRYRVKGKGQPALRVRPRSRSCGRCLPQRYRCTSSFGASCGVRCRGGALKRKPEEEPVAQHLSDTRVSTSSTEMSQTYWLRSRTALQRRWRRVWAFDRPAAVVDGHSGRSVRWVISRKVPQRRTRFGLQLPIALIVLTLKPNCGAMRASTRSNR